MRFEVLQKAARSSGITESTAQLVVGKPPLHPPTTTAAPPRAPSPLLPQAYCRGNGAQRLVLCNIPVARVPVCCKERVTGGKAGKQVEAHRLRARERLIRCVLLACSQAKMASSPIRSLGSARVTWANLRLRAVNGRSVSSLSAPRNARQRRRRRRKLELEESTPGTWPYCSLLLILLPHNTQQNTIKGPS